MRAASSSSSGRFRAGRDPAGRGLLDRFPSARSAGAHPGECQTAAGRGRRARLEMAVHLSRSGRSPRSTSWSCPPDTPVSFRLTSATVMNSFFMPQLGSQIYAMGGMTTHLNLLADEAGRVFRASPPISAAMDFRTCASPSRRCRPATSTAGSQRRAAQGRRSMTPAMPHWRSRAATVPPATYPCGRRRSCSSAFIDLTTRQAPANARRRRRILFAAEAGGRLTMLGRLTWAAIPFNEPLPLITSAVVAIIVFCRARAHHRQGLVACICGANG